MLSQNEIKTFDCGIRGVKMGELIKEYPLLIPILSRFPNSPGDFYFDVKVHMLMPGQFPCIPNWHRDFVPRIDGVPDLDLTKPEYPLYLLVSGAPFTEFKDGRKVEPWQWVKFTQEDLHRGTVSDKFTWRLFIRASHREITPEVNIKLGKVRHSQVYLDSNSFTW